MMLHFQRFIRVVSKYSKWYHHWLINDTSYQGGRGATVISKVPQPQNKAHIHLDICNQTHNLLANCTSVPIIHNNKPYIYPACRAEGLAALELQSISVRTTGPPALALLCSAPGDRIEPTQPPIWSDNPDRINVMAGLNSSHWIWQTFRCYLPVTGGGKNNK